jgi:hypothetical protein
MYGDPYRAARAALVSGDAAPALSLLAATHEDHEARIHALNVLGHKTTAFRLPQVESLLEQDPENADLWLLVGALQAESAWMARGAARVSQTSDEQISGLRHHMVRARRSLERAAELRTGDPAPWYQLMGCAMAAKTYPNEPHDMWKELVQRGGDVSYEANRLRLLVLTEKWHGSEAECFAFARECSQGAPAGHPLHALIPLAHVEAYVELRSSDSVLTRARAVFRYFKRRDVRQEIDAAADRLLAGAHAFAAHPASPEANQAFAFVFDDRGDIDRSRRHLERSGDEAIWPWGYFGDSSEALDRARVRAGLPPSPRR